MDFKHQNYVIFRNLRERLFYFLPLYICNMLLRIPSCYPSTSGIKLLLVSGCIHKRLVWTSFKQK